MRQRKVELKYETMKRARYFPFKYKRIAKLYSKVVTYDKKIQQLEAIKLKSQNELKECTKSMHNELEELKSMNTKLENKITYMTLMYSSRINELKLAESKFADYDNQASVSSTTSGTETIDETTKKANEQTHYPIDKINFKCDLCNVETKSEVELKLHKQGKDHISKELLVHGIFHCTICDMDVSCKTTYEAHVKTLYHMKRKEKQEKFVSNINKNEPSAKLRIDSHMKGVTKLSEKEIFRCQICEIEATDQSSLDLHMQGKKHKSKETPAIIDSPSSSILKNMIHKCEICQIVATDQSGLDAHMRGKKHKSKENNVANMTAQHNVPSEKFHNPPFLSNIHPMNPFNDTKKNENNNEAKQNKLNDSAISHISYRLCSGHDPNQSYISEEGLRCLLCDVQASNLSEFNAHLSGKKHKSKVKLETELQIFYAKNISLPK